jgi:chaperone required for assembly of F1-ATPase
MADADNPKPPAPISAPSSTKVLGREPPVLRKRFYKTATAVAAGDAFTVHLDGRALRTPKKLPLILPVRPLADAFAAEWDAQINTIHPGTMPVTTLVFTAIDAVAGERLAVAAEIGRYAASDLLCYRAEGPDVLVERQKAGWEPVIAWAEALLGVTFVRATGLMPVSQPGAVQGAVEAQLQSLDPIALAAVHVITTLSGSALLALAVLRQRLTLAEAWSLANIDEDWQIEKWGMDDEAITRRATRTVTAKAAADVLDMLRVPA